VTLVTQLYANVTHQDTVLSLAFALRVALWIAIGAVVVLLLGAITYVLNAKRVLARLLAAVWLVSRATDDEN
jgi:hypothetical protein